MKKEKPYLFWCTLLKISSLPQNQFFTQNEFNYYSSRLYLKQMFNLDNMTQKNDSKGWPYRKLIIGPSGSGKTNYLLNSIQKDNYIIDKIYLYAKDLEEATYQLLINQREQTGIKNLNDPTAFIEYSNSMDDILNNIEGQKRKREKEKL